MPETPLHITLACDGNPLYTMLLRTCMASVLSHARDDETLHFHVLDGGIGSEVKRAIDALQSMHPFRVRYYPAGEAGPHGGAAYYRLRVGYFLDTISRTLYLDVDTVALRSLKTLYDQPLNGYAFGACLDGAHRAKARRLGVPVGNYFNSGVMLMDLDIWRKGRIYEKCLATAKNHPEKLRYQDQDVLNLLFHGHYHRLSPAWNTLSVLADQDTDFSQCGILHFAGDRTLRTPAGAFLIQSAQRTGFSPESVMALLNPGYPVPPPQ